MFIQYKPAQENSSPIPLSKVKPVPPPTPPKPNAESIKSHKDWEDTLSNFEMTLSQSFTEPSRSSSVASMNSRCHR